MNIGKSRKQGVVSASKYSCSLKQTFAQCQIFEGRHWWAAQYTSLRFTHTWFL